MALAIVKEHVEDAEAVEHRELLMQFASALSHDIPSPLRTTVEFSKLLSEQYQGKPLDERGRGYLKYILENGQQAQAMLQALVAYIRLDINPLKCEALNANAVIRSSILHHPKLVPLRDEIVVDELPKIVGDKARLSQAFTEILLNAITFRDETKATKIRISAKDCGHEVEIAIRDNGIGMDPRCVDKAFELFYRYHPEDTYQGIGMGLAIAKKVLEIHGGSLWIDETAIDEGAVVKLRIATHHE